VGLHIHLIAFLGVAAVLVVTPGVDMALVTKNAILHGRRQAVASALGVNLGIAMWTFASALGLAAVIRASAAAFDVLKFAGAVYLVALGIQSLRAARSDPRRPGAAQAPSKPCVPASLAFRQGLRSNVLNPKIAVLFTSLLPEFIAPGGSILTSTLVLGAVFNLMGIAWLCGYALAASRVRSRLRESAVVRWLEGLTGVVLIALGIRVAAEHR
jgi:RhtB (resistance to homoserine/threonine) family protein